MIQDYFKEYFGRDATPDELNYYNKFISQEGMTPYEVGQSLQATPEYQNKLFQQQIPQLEQMYARNDERMLGQAGDALARRFAQQGRTTTGSGYTQAYMNAARDLAARRNTQLADFYQGGLNQMRQIPYAQGQGATQRQYGIRDSNTDWQRQLQMYQLQKSDYDNYLNQANRRARNQGIGSLVGSGLGAAAGFAMPGAGPFAAYLGSQMGSGLGSTFGGF